MNDNKIPIICRKCIHMKNEKCDLNFIRASDSDDFFADDLKDVVKCPDYDDDRYSMDELMNIDVKG